MTQVYYYLILLSSVTSLAVAGFAYWRNRFQLVGPVFGGAMVLVALWLFGFAQYFRPLEPDTALWAAQWTLIAGILNATVLFHSMCVFVGKGWRLRWWISISYGLSAIFMVLTWSGHAIVGLKEVLPMHHYVTYHRALYPFLCAQIAFWQFAGVAVLFRTMRQTVGYKRTQLTYFIVAWFVVFLTTNSIILPIEYDINIQPLGFFVLPLNLALLAYVMGKARLADYNVVIARVLLHALTLMIVAGMGLILVLGMKLVAPNFMNPAQALFMVMMVTIVGMLLATTLPRWLPYAERMMQDRLFGERLSYQEKLLGMAKELSTLPTEDQVLNAVTRNIYTHMQLTRVLVLLENPLSGLYQLVAERGLRSDESTDGYSLKTESATIRYLLESRDALVCDELARLVDGATQRAIEEELNRLQAVVCVPIVLDDKFLGVLCLGEKLNKEMFYVSDLRLLSNITTEVALAIKYRRMEDHVLRKNKLVELGTVAAGVAHEIRNPLASIRTFAQLLPTQIDDPEFKNEFSKLVLNDVDRITKVIESMLAFARPAQVTIAEHPAHELVEESLLLVQSRLKSKNIVLERHYHEQPALRVDKQKILQVLVNLLNNASDALPKNGRIRISIGTRFMESDRDDKVRQKFAAIEVSDNGPGIPATVRSRLFDPFFTTKKEGTGLGLSISQKIVRDHGGVITVSSVEGKGTTFQINLPLI
jgi:two-component system, NtrC family, sensor histidine kinase HydH